MPHPTHAEATYVFLHSPSEAPDARMIALQVPEFEWYGERALLLARESDLVGVAHPVDERYLRYLHALGIGPRFENVFMVEGVEPGRGLSERLSEDSASLERLARHLRKSACIVLSPFFGTSASVAVGNALGALLGRSVEVVGGPPELVRQVHEKRFARELAQSLGIPVAPGDVVTIPFPSDRRPGDLDDLRRSIERRAATTGRVIVRGSSGASGSSTFTLLPDDVDGVVDAIGRRTDNTVYLVEPFFEATISPNVEVVIDPGRAVHPKVAVTDQILSPELVYLGSTYPSSARRKTDMVSDSLAIVDWMRSRGFSGRIGFDFVEHDRGDDGGAGYFLTEINPRVNGASYPVALIARLTAAKGRVGAPAPAAFRTSNVGVAVRDFNGLEALCRSLLYDPESGDGVVPHTVGALPVGKVGVACFGDSPSRVEELFAEFVSMVRPLETAAL